MRVSITVPPCAAAGWVTTRWMALRASHKKKTRFILMITAPPTNVIKLPLNTETPFMSLHVDE